MSNILIQESWIDVTRNLMLGDSDVYESAYDNVGELYRVLVKEHGRCIGKIFVEENDRIKHIGWEFQKRRKYTDTNESYLAETIVTLHTAEPTKTVEYHYHDMN